MLRLQAGADAWVRNDAQRTPLDIARRQRSTECIRCCLTTEVQQHQTSEPACLFRAGIRCHCCKTAGKSLQTKTHQSYDYDVSLLGAHRLLEAAQHKKAAAASAAANRLSGDSSGGGAARASQPVRPRRKAASLAGRTTAEEDDARPSAAKREGGCSGRVVSASSSAQHASIAEEAAGENDQRVSPAQSAPRASSLQSAVAVVGNSPRPGSSAAAAPLGPSLASAQSGVEQSRLPSAAASGADDRWSDSAPQQAKPQEEGAWQQPRSRRRQPHRRGAGAEASAAVGALERTGDNATAVRQSSAERAVLRQSQPVTSSSPTSGMSVASEAAAAPAAGSYAAATVPRVAASLDIAVPSEESRPVPGVQTAPSWLEVTRCHCARSFRTFTLALCPRNESMR